MMAHEPPGLMGAKILSHKTHNTISANQLNQAQMRHDSLGASTLVGNGDIKTLSKFEGDFSQAFTLGNG